MAHGRVWVGIALLLALAGTAAAQPVYPGVGGAGGLSAAPPAAPALFPPGTATVAGPPAPSIQTLSALSDEHPAVRELPSGLPDLIPPPAHGGGHGHVGCEGGHEISGFMTPFVPEHRGFYVNGEFLLMRARYTDLDYTVLGAASGLGTIGPIESANYKLGTGFRAEVGYRFGEGKWETVFGYTYFRDSGDNLSLAGPGTTLLPTLTRPGLTDRALTAQTHADLDYQVFDALFARRFLVDEHFAVRALGGVRLTDMRQDFDALYNGADARSAAVNTRSQFRGAGPLVGAEAVLVGWKGFHLYSRAYGGLIAGLNTNRVVETNDAGQTTYVNTSYDVRKVVPMGSVGIGVGWQYRTLAIRGGYEVTHWQGIFERPRFTDDVGPGKVITRPGNLTLEGLFLQATLSF